MLLDLVQPFLRATVSHEFHGGLYYKLSILNDLEYSHVRLRLYLYCTDEWLVLLNSIPLALFSCAT